MIIGKVIGSVVSTDKDAKLVGFKFMIVETLAETSNTKRLVAVDDIGAGVGDTVLVATGSAARYGCAASAAPVDAAIVGIIDNGNGLSELK